MFQSSAVTPIYTTTSVGRGSGSILWVFWGTGDKEKPLARTTQDIFFAVKDPDRTSTYTLGQLQDITNSIFNEPASGWYINLAAGEKVLTDSSVFGGMINWTTYMPPAAIDPCSRGGTSKLYSLAMMPIVIGGVTYEVGAGLFAETSGHVVGQRSVTLGTGVAQVPVFSQPGGPGPTEVFITTSGAGDQDSTIVTAADLPNSPWKQHLNDTTPSSQVIHWLDQRVQP